MGEIQALSTNNNSNNNNNNNNKSKLLDEFERLSVEIQLNQAMLRRSLSEPGSSFFMVGPPAPQLVRRPVEQGKRGASWPWGFTKMVKKLFRPVVFRRRREKMEHDCDHEHHHRGGKKDEETNCKDLRSWKRFSKSVRL